MYPFTIVADSVGQPIGLCRGFPKQEAGLDLSEKAGNAGLPEDDVDPGVEDLVVGAHLDQGHVGRHVGAALDLVQQDLALKTRGGNHVKIYDFFLLVTSP